MCFIIAITQTAITQIAITQIAITQIAITQIAITQNHWLKLRLQVKVVI
jgi:hypothetical protein